MKRKSLLLLCALWCMSVGWASAQNLSVSGTVLSKEDGLPVIGASVLVVGTTVGTITDLDGQFTIAELPKGAQKIQVSYIGMQSQTLPIQPKMTITLAADAAELEEVIVTGYGTFKKSSYTGAATTMATQKLENIPTASLESKLAGAIPGVQIGSSSGAPGAVSSIRVRGMGSVNADKDPLYVIDGTPMYSGNLSAFDGPGKGYSDAGTSGLASLNSNDIESITVIKDAAAASLYGSRAANGVVVITTKRGAAGKARFNFSSDWGFSNQAINYRPTLSGDARRELIMHGLQNYATYEKVVDGNGNRVNPVDYANSRINTYATKPASGWTDWKDLLFKTGSHQNYEFSAQGGSEKTKFYTSLGYVNQEGIALQSGLERLSGKASVSHTEGALQLEAATQFSKMHQTADSEGTAFSSPIMGAAWTMSPADVPYNADGSFNTSGFALVRGTNPLVAAAYNYNKSDITRSLNAVTATWKFLKTFSLKEKISYDYINTRQDVWWDKRSKDGQTANGSLQIRTRTQEILNTQTQLSYADHLADKHHVDALIGFETEDFARRHVVAKGSDFPGTVNSIATAGKTSSSSYKEEYRMASFLGRANYNYQDKYYLGASYRIDGSSRFAREHRWGHFWSLSGAWRFSEETFMAHMADVVSSGKLRVSYGANGTLPKAFYGYMDQYAYGEMYNGKSGMAVISAANTDLKWEKNLAFNVGLDLTLWQVLNVGLDYYARTSSDLLFDVPISYVPGYLSGTNATMLKNIGALLNQGFELTLSSVILDKKDFRWSAMLNMAHNSNVLKKIDGKSEIVKGNLIHRVGEPYYSYYMYDYAGVDPATGKEQYYVYKEVDDNKWVKTNETTTDISKAKQVIVGNNQATLEGGLTNELKWKNVDVNLTLTYAFGGEAVDAAYWLHENGGASNMKGAIPSYYDIDKMWKKPGDHAVLPKFQYGNTDVMSSRWLMPTDHLRLKNMTIGYSLPSSIVKKIGLQKTRVFFAGANLLTWKSSKLLVDPEMPENGMCYFQSPALRTFTFGIQIGL